jgi:hypothetical protein
LSVKRGTVQVRRVSGKIVENWWCPFAYNRKEEYAEGSIDKSFWHLYPQELEKLHPDDCKNPIWNENGED